MDNKPLENIENVCIAFSPYALLQYLLLTDMVTATERTFYFLNESFDARLRQKLHCAYCPTGKNPTTKEKIARRLRKLKMRFLKYKTYPFLRTANLYVQDHQYPQILIGKRSYSLLSDGPNTLTINMQTNSAFFKLQQKRISSFKGKIESLVYGPISVRNWGNNRQCIKFYLTEANNSPVLDGKQTEICSFSEMWQQASKEKREWILSLFDITPDDIKLINSHPVVFLSQPLVNDCGLTEEEYVGLLQRIFANYKESDILIKTHPRDHFNYKKHFPKIEVFSKTVITQLLVLVGANVERVVTICSSSIEAFPETTQADFYTAACHPKLYAFYGDTLKPFRKANRPTLK